LAEAGDAAIEANLDVVAALADFARQVCIVPSSRLWYRAKHLTAFVFFSYSSWLRFQPC
jgi:hypothetical protein